MRVFVFTWVILSSMSGTVCAQQARAKKYTAPLAGTAVLRDVEDKYGASVYSSFMPEPDAGTEQERLREIKERIARNHPHRASAEGRKTSSSVLAPQLGINFVADSNSGVPPDNYSAVSAGGKTVNVMNENIAVHDAATGAMIMRKSLMAVSASVGLNYSVHATYNYRYDPKVVYDPVADRFICVMLNGTDVYNWIVLGFSQSNDPTGGWNFYKFYGDFMADTTWFDYPAISITQNEFFLTGNKIKYDSSWQAGFTRSVIYQVRKQDGYNGDTVLHYQIWDSVQYNNKFLRCLYPLNPGDNLLGPAQYFLSNRNFDTSNDSVFIVQVPDTIGSTDTLLSVAPVVSTGGSYGVPPNARETDTSWVLQTNDGRVLGGYIEGNEMQFVSTSLDPANGASAVYHGVISNFNTAPVLSGRLVSIDTLDFGYPNISYAGTPGQSIISFDYSGPHTYPGFGAVLFDGSNYSDMTIVRAGDSLITIPAYPVKEQRWGDYSGSQPAWGMPGTVWVEGIYGRKNRNYGNYMAQLTSPYHDAAPVVQKSAKPESKLYPNPAMAYVQFDFDVDKDQNYSFVIYDFRGRAVDKVLDNFCRLGRNTIQFNMASLKPGTYLLKAVGSNGEHIAIHTFVRE